jgi:hypothetical protein
MAAFKFGLVYFSDVFIRKSIRGHLKFLSANLGDVESSWYFWEEPNIFKGFLSAFVPEIMSGCDGELFIDLKGCSYAVPFLCIDGIDQNEWVIGIFFHLVDYAHSIVSSFDYESLWFKARSFLLFLETHSLVHT